MIKLIPYKTRKKCQSCGDIFYIETRRLSEKNRGKFCSKKCLGSKNIGNLGIYAEKNQLPEINPAWKGGITPINKALRNSFVYKEWRKSVFERDGYTCQLCGRKKSGKLNADHIKQFAYYPKLRFEISNGRTLCKDCHQQTDTYRHKEGRFIYA